MSPKIVPFRGQVVRYAASSRWAGAPASWARSRARKFGTGAEPSTPSRLSIVAESMTSASASAPALPILTASARARSAFTPVLFGLAIQARQCPRRGRRCPRRWSRRLVARLGGEGEDRQRQRRALVPAGHRWAVVEHALCAPRRARPAVGRRRGRPGCSRSASAASSSAFSPARLTVATSAQADSHDVGTGPLLGVVDGVHRLEHPAPDVARPRPVPREATPLRQRPAGGGWERAGHVMASAAE